jgi:hypothetical protein
MQIANPIYGVAFKFMVAKAFLSLRGGCGAGVRFAGKKSRKALPDGASIRR